MFIKYSTEIGSIMHFIFKGGVMSENINYVKDVGGGSKYIYLNGC